MKNQLPEWATNKIKEGMEAFLKIVNEYGEFEATFSQLTFADDIGFDAVVSWSHFSLPDIEYEAKFSVHYNFQQLFNCIEEKINTWQFVVEDSGFEMSGQFFYMELFQCLSKYNISLIQSARKGQEA